MCSVGFHFPASVQMLYPSKIQCLDAMDRGPNSYKDCLNSVQMLLKFRYAERPYCSLTSNLPVNGTSAPMLTTFFSSS